MKLSDFVRETLVEIVAGVTAADVDATGARISGATVFDSTTKSDYHVTSGTYAGDVEFDVAVTVLESSSIDGGIKAGISILGLSGGAGSKSEGSSGSRVKFAVPVVLPQHEATLHHRGP